MELSKLKSKLQLGHELRLKWIPNGNEKLSGEVKGEVIYVYEEDKQEALDTLRHEFWIAISKVLEPYNEVANKLLTSY